MSNDCPTNCSTITRHGNEWSCMTCGRPFVRSVDLDALQDGIALLLMELCPEQMTSDQQKRVKSWKPREGEGGA